MELCRDTYTTKSEDLFKEAPSYEVLSPKPLFIINVVDHIPKYHYFILTNLHS